MPDGLYTHRTTNGWVVRDVNQGDKIVFTALDVTCGGPDKSRRVVELQMKKMRRQSPRR